MTEKPDTPSLHPDQHGFRRWLFIVGVVAAIGIVGLTRTDLLVAAEYQVAKVAAVQQVPGGDMNARLVIVDLGEYQRALRTSDWLIQTHLDQPVCVRKAQFLMRRWVRHTLALPGYCQLLRRPAPASEPGFGGLD